MKDEAYNLHGSSPTVWPVTEELFKGCHLKPKLIRFISQLQLHCLCPLHSISSHFFLFSFLSFFFWGFCNLREGCANNGLSLPGGFKASTPRIFSQVQGGISANTCSLTFARTLRHRGGEGAGLHRVYSALESSCTPLTPPDFEWSHLKSTGCLWSPLI